MPESATEWIDSASIDAEPVITKPTNLATAMPALASSAAMTALVPCPPPAMAAGYGATVAVIPARIGAMSFLDQVAADPDAPAVDDLTRRRTRASCSIGRGGSGTGCSTTAACRSAVTSPC